MSPVPSVGDTRIAISLSGFSSSNVEIEIELCPVHLTECPVMRPTK